ncbi:hypothetical protein DH2020_035973 [Rehmannia glutinosa]|uniref:Xylanase inhibitor N-terminal domain-containing protein n=1 Tax=Rehmannia glutinosa TaxID=99300 RepID=A0ABR0V864_REHGL
MSSSPPLKLPKFTFGCPNSTLAETIGVAGFGRGALSLSAQLATTSLKIGNYFSYCLISHSITQHLLGTKILLILPTHHCWKIRNTRISTVVMPRRNYFYEFFDGEAKKKVGCVMLMDGGDEAETGGGPSGLLGNYQQ